MLRRAACCVTVLRLRRCCRSLKGATRRRGRPAARHRARASKRRWPRRCRESPRRCRRRSAKTAASRRRALSCTRMPSHFHSARKSRGIERGELGVLERMRQHQRAEGRGALASGRGARPRASANSGTVGRRERRARPPRSRRPSGRHVGQRGLGEPRRDADAQRAGDQLEQRPAAGGIERVEPAADERRQHLWRCVARSVRRPRRAPASGRSLPPAGCGQISATVSAQVADIVVATAEQHRIDRARHQLARGCARLGHGADGSAAGQRGQRLAAVGIGRGARNNPRSAAAWRCAPG